MQLEQAPEHETKNRHLRRDEDRGELKQPQEWKQRKQGCVWWSAMAKRCPGDEMMLETRRRKPARSMSETRGRLPSEKRLGKDQNVVNDPARAVKHLH